MAEAETNFITDKEIYEEVLLKAIPKAQKFIWIGTSDLKDLYVDKQNKMVPFLEILSDLIIQGILVRLMHAKEPGPLFLNDFAKYPHLKQGLEKMLCPRVHFKSIIIDGEIAYTGSANLTGAGLGAKGVNKRNFEAGIVTTDKKLITQIMQQFDNIWIGNFCSACQRKEYCREELAN
jgi:phosphatidylserine/phosphatidylglycerophosphate/cardiolipin synthase-like enzyme